MMLFMLSFSSQSIDWWKWFESMACSGGCMDVCWSVQSSSRMTACSRLLHACRCCRLSWGRRPPNPGGHGGNPLE